MRSSGLSGQVEWARCIGRATRRLKREVAIKILPEEFSSDAERIARFRREAEVLASLNHPHIAAIHHLEEFGENQLLILELVEGETLADRISRGPIPVDESLVIAKQIAEALEAAHEKGVIHRDLKPANIKLTDEGKVKVLDFGLAKAFAADTPDVHRSNSPTISMAATNAGVILGTAAYMSPEQARGRSIDKRADIWAFGCVLYEMLTGERAFDGEEVTDILAAVIRADADWQKLPAATHRAIRQLLRRCLEKDRKERLPDIGMARIEIKDALSAPLESQTSPQATSSNRIRVAWLLIALLAISLFVTVVLWSPWRTVAPNAPLRLSSELGADISLATNDAGNSSLAISPDGALLAFVGTANGRSEIYVRPFGQLEATPLAGTNGAISPFFSPDGRWLGFFADGKLKKIAVTGGAVVTLCPAPNGRGGSWGDDGNIVFCPDIGASITLQRVSSAGGKPESFTKLAQGEVRHSWPQVLPGAKALLYSSSNIGNWNDAKIVVQPLPSGVPKVLVQGGYRAQYLPGGYLVYVHDATLFTVPFDVDRLEIKGQPVPAVEGISTVPANGSAQFAVSNSGTLAYLPGEKTNVGDAPILWMDRQGKTMPLRSNTVRLEQSALFS
jgi:serine/threonine protein kinase